ncbi:dynein regulatory complex protein 9-like [Aphis gossypii]|uniref:dynein regulatory complex protein 9-like n=1 Tax=Aphis gossypii TaxID=80765 RepID=UPI0021598870|nr:dynein regulatory complex protein 9-like [Aphis gossypii]
MELNENLGKLNSAPTIQENELLSEIFEKTLLEISIMDSIYGSSIISEYVKDIFQVSIDELHNFGTLKTLHAIVDENEQQKKLRFRLQKDEREPSNDEQFIEEYESLEKKIQKFKQKEEEIDAIIEKCTADGEHKAIRRETEKNYVDKWEKSRVENFKFKFKSEELELQKYIIELQAKMKTDQVVDKENEQYLDYSIKELEEQIEYWECKYKTDNKEIDEKLENLIVTLEEKTKEIECLKKTFNERKIIIEEHAENKQRAEEEKKLIDHMEKMATKIQAWWRGTMVRRRLGPYKHLSGPRKKSIKKSLVNKTKKTKSK